MCLLLSKYSCQRSRVHINMYLLRLVCLMSQVDYQRLKLCIRITINKRSVLNMGLKIAGEI